MTPQPLRLVVLGLSITSSWGNGHATTYRALLRALADRGHDVLFLERDVPWYADNRDLPHPPYGRVCLYETVEDLQRRFYCDVRDADCVIVGSYVPDGVTVADWVFDVATGRTAFYDIDTPVTLAAIEDGTCSYLTRAQIPEYDLYLSFTGGPVLTRLEEEFGAVRARPLYCSFDPLSCFPLRSPARWDLGYMGTYSEDRQPGLDRLLLEPARTVPQQQFVVAGSRYPEDIAWPPNVERLDHVAPAGHRTFYASQRFTLNLTRAEMTRLGHSPSVRLFEAAACATPIISDPWAGLETFFEPGRDILIAETTDDVLRHLRDLQDVRRRAIGRNGRARVLASHTPRHRVDEFERYLAEAACPPRRRVS